MKRTRALIAALSFIAALPLLAQERESKDLPGKKAAAPNGTVWTKVLKSREQRGKLQDAFQSVRGDSGRWSDDPQMQLAPAFVAKPEKLALDDWFDQLADKSFQPGGEGDTWLLLRTRQLDDNDRVWVKRIERRGDQFIVVVHKAKWQGKYRKNFTYYNVFGVNLGRLAPGKYEAKWVIRPLQFRTFEGDGGPRGNWSKDESPADKKPEEHLLRFTIAAS